MLIIAGALTWAALNASGPAGAVTGTLDGSAGSVERFVIDADPNNTPANTLNLTGTGQLQGTVQECVAVAIGGTVQIDIVIDEVNPADKFTGGEVDVG
ncbi:MAG TPA: hypothetical protein VMR52_12255, partial [Dehalococcoidia bacterium]|nr:hypothetical protein [Dehalococcoidia bacterium]